MALPRPNLVWEPSELEVAARQAFPPGSDFQPPPRQEQADATGTVRVTVDASARVEAVEISPRWRDRLTAADLVSTLRETFRIAVHQAARTYAMATLAARAAGAEPPTLGDDQELAPGPGRSPDPAADRAGWWSWLRETQAYLQELRERRARIEQAGRAGPRDVTGPNGCLTATFQGTELIEIAGDPHRIWHASIEHLRHDALAVLSNTDQSTHESRFE